MATADRTSRGVFLTVFAILFAVLALSDFTKFLQHMTAPERGGLVVLGLPRIKVGNTMAPCVIIGDGLPIPRQQHRLGVHETNKKDDPSAALWKLERVSP